MRANASASLILRTRAIRQSRDKGFEIRTADNVPATEPFHPERTGSHRREEPRAREPLLDEILDEIVIAASPCGGRLGGV
jgi:hypothetical protein